jgi:hypothetical protein
MPVAPGIQHLSRISVIILAFRAFYCIILSEVMRKLLVSILSIVYLTASTGTSVDMHYCMGKLVDWTFSHDDSGSCGSCGMEKKGSDNGCCKDEQKFVKNTIDQKAAGNDLQFLLFSPALPEPGQCSAIAIPMAEALTFPRAHAPPLSRAASLHLLHCNFRI